MRPLVAFFRENPQVLVLVVKTPEAGEAESEDDRRRAAVSPRHVGGHGGHAIGAIVRSGRRLRYLPAPDAASKSSRLGVP
jgi:hypothetical protein